MFSFQIFIINVTRQKNMEKQKKTYAEYETYTQKHQPLPLTFRPQIHFLFLLFYTLTKWHMAYRIV